MGVQRCVPGGTGQVLVFSVRNMLQGARLFILLSQTVIDQEYFVTMSTYAHQEVIRPVRERAERERAVRVIGPVRKVRAEFE